MATRVPGVGFTAVILYTQAEVFNNNCNNCPPLSVGISSVATGEGGGGVMY